MKLEKNSKILVLMIAGIGDFIESVPALAALRKAYPSAFIGLAVSRRCVSYAEKCPYVNEVYGVPFPYRDSFWFLHVFMTFNFFFTILRLRKKGFDAAVNLNEISSRGGARRMRRFMRMIGPKITAGRNTSGLGGFYSLKAEEAGSDGKSHAEYFMRAVSLLIHLTDLPALLSINPERTILKSEDRGVEGLIEQPQTPGRLELWTAPEEEKQSAQLLSCAGGRPVVFIHPGSDRATRCWMPEYFADVIYRLQKKYSAMIVVGIGKNDRQLLPAVASRIYDRQLFKTTEGMSLLSVAAVIKMSRLVICNNSMAMHMSAAAGTPAVVICASGDILRDRPFSNTEKIKMIWKPLECSPCYYWNCPKREYMKCMKQITVDEVFAEAEKMLAES